jgi:hypothetical protein
MKQIGAITVDVTYPNQKTVAVDFAVREEVCLGPGDRWYPGVQYDGNWPEVDGGTVQDDLDVGEVVAYGINEGRVTESEIDIWTEDAPEGSPTNAHIRWRVRPDSVVLLREHGIID